MGVSAAASAFIQAAQMRLSRSMTEVFVRLLPSLGLRRPLSHRRCLNWLSFGEPRARAKARFCRCCSLLLFALRLSLSPSLHRGAHTFSAARFKRHAERNDFTLASSKLHCRFGVRSLSPSSRPGDPGQVELCAGAFWHTPKFSSWEVQFSTGLSPCPPLPLLVLPRRRIRSRS